MTISQDQGEHRPDTAQAYWVTESGHGELRREAIEAPQDGEALVRTLYSGVSRGTERVVHEGRVPERVADLMHAPHQEGDFPGPVKYGYLNVGVVEQGPHEWLGKTVFALHPHQDYFVLPTSQLTVIPEDVPSRRAVLTGIVEVAINAIWEAGPRLGDRVAVVGGGLVGGVLATLLRKYPLDRLELVDADPGKEELARKLGIRFAAPTEAMDDCDIVFHCSASDEGLKLSLQLAGDDSDVIELSWFADKEVTLPLGEDFHARRLNIRSSQVGAVALPRRHRRTNSQRLQEAANQLKDPLFDTFITSECTFQNLPSMLVKLFERPGGFCHVVAYPQPEE
ncbi:zinc-binding alcohol dehydrogenase [Arthrobacter sp. TES]|uniref:zinc-dependent alcohol dehydrogenase n=1 Tax=Paenarthrobacter ureafaciens TaxID=37931 RepID=UPI0003981A07|nr:zinc-binding alcohol dehydrogenase [Paenarthrobacter ureafaciens]AOY72720.1 dehydrogenase [Arthrobacter sp. ZXY-2]ERI35190.1 dehydrogenase [Arthrobacter sp. AK-YN10]QOI64349.1 zinc-binding alcohol dehydrogenase [Arthrobacter sp. TES]QQQ62927.1 zinc-binding alcohol dehydrogenase [Paenarthrobacter ureafaciens]UOD81992.1 zinc-binding alcohol dehydrogenase [Paenarthrobacter ureafaciens]